MWNGFNKTTVSYKFSIFVLIKYSWYSTEYTNYNILNFKCTFIMAFRTQMNNSSAEDSSVDCNSETRFHSLSPISNVQPRKLRFASPDDNDEKIDKCQRIGRITRSRSNNISISPPYRKVRALRLFDTPATPKTILEKSSLKCSNYLRNDVTKDDAEKKLDTLNLKIAERPRCLPLHSKALDNVIQQCANVNPFTPDSLLGRNKKRCRTQFSENISDTSLQTFLNTEDDILNNSETEHSSEIHQAPKRLALQDTNISRYKKEFVELDVIGVGEFGKVYKCLNRLDGCIYAIKKSIKPVAGSSYEKRALNEVWAHAVLGKHDNVVRYYSAWAEDNHMLIQNEYCNGGSLQTLLQHKSLGESDLKILLLHVAEGLRYIHSNDLVHMDLKAGNIFFTKVPSAQRVSLTEECFENDMDGIYEELSDSEWLITYKIGDLGHVTSVKEPSVEEGDCRYLPREILNEDFSTLFKADMFAFGLTLYEAAGGGPLPKNGPEWHDLRNGNIPRLSGLSQQFHDVIELMTHPDPHKRPCSRTLFDHPVLNALESKSKAQLNQELIIEKRRNELLLRKLKDAKRTIKAFEQAARLTSPQYMPEKERVLRSHSLRKRTAPCLESKLDDMCERGESIINNFQF